MHPRPGTQKRSQGGAAMVEFAIVALLFFTLLLGAFEVSRVAWIANTAGEATRIGARTAAMCDVNAAAIKTKMKALLPGLLDKHIVVTYTPSGCTSDSCSQVSVSVTNFTPQTFVPGNVFSPTLNGYTTTLPREYMNSNVTVSAISSPKNPACQ